MRIAVRRAVIGTFVMAWAAAAGAATAPPTVRTDELQAEIQGFLKAELGAHLGAIATLDPPPERVFGARTTGKFTWGTFMRALAVYRDFSGDERLADRDLASTLARMGLIEARGGGVTFAQLYPALTLHHFGTDLESNRVWASLDEAERASWRSLLDPTRFYDPKTKSVGNLSENYYGVAARIAAVAHHVGVQKDRAMLDDLIDLAARQFRSGHLYADDKSPLGTFDRYSNEYARFLWVSAEMAGRQDVLELLRPSLRRQMALWWDMAGADGYSTPWGRSIGPISYMDTLEIVAFLAQHPEFRPAPLEQLAATFYQAWRWLRAEYRDDRHLLDVFAFGRGNYYYIRGDRIAGDREWQQTAGFFGKVGESAHGFFPAVLREGLSEFPARPALPEVRRFEFFRNEGRLSGVWLVREGALRFALPITTGNMRPVLADYLPAPHGLAGFAAPVERQYPALVPLLELEDGTTVAAADGADEIEPAADARSLKVAWRRFSVVAAKHGVVPPAEPGFRSEVVFRLDGDRLRREETFIASRSVTVRRFFFAVPSTASKATELEVPEGRAWAFDSPEGILEVGVDAPWPMDVRLWAPGDAPEGQGPRRGLPLHLQIEARSLMIQPSARPLSWSVWLRVRPSGGGAAEVASH